MTKLDILPPSLTNQYICLSNLNLYDSPECEELATQAIKGRILEFVDSENVNNALKIRLCEDDYEAWLPIKKIEEIKPLENRYKAKIVSRLEIENKINNIIDFTKKAMSTPNVYLWGGTVAPDYDCSGLMQAAFISEGIWLPRDSYQQEAFTQRIPQDDLQRGDLVFFGKERVNHVGLYLGNLYYIHSSGKEVGNNKIDINRLLNEDNPVSSYYYQELTSFGRVNSSYQPRK